MSIKIVIIGAGSAEFSAGIVRDLCLTPSLYGSKVVLMDIDIHRLEMVSLLAKKLYTELGAYFDITTTDNRIKALEGADFVINTAQLGGHSWVENQRSISEEHGYYRGADLSTITQMNFLLDVARDMEDVCPDAWLIQSSNPVFEGCTLITRETKINTIGLCHGHLCTREITRALGLDRDKVYYKAIGFNHWIWLIDFLYEGNDAYPLLDKWIEKDAEIFWQKPRYYMEQQMSRAAIHQYHLYGLLPIGDTPRMGDFPRTVGWLYNANLKNKEYFYGEGGGFDSEIGWAKYLDELAERIVQVEKVSVYPNQKATDFFKPTKSGEQIIPIINSLANNQIGKYQVNIPNRGQLISGLPEDIVVEVEAEIDGEGIHGLGPSQLPQRLMAGAMYPRLMEAEMLIEAAKNMEREMIKILLLMDHRTNNEEQVDELLNKWFNDSLNRTYRRR